ncbi:hypothetical protein Tco_0624652 [Tanacetum coccineum]|uniref:Uncharacterized protein n=1 Tax=Tanacetum coccineum TaxID=301880 RepID=A0ABQ4WEK1_9ASTR
MLSSNTMKEMIKKFEKCDNDSQNHLLCWTIAQVLIIMSQNKEKLKENEKGVEIRNIEDTERPKPTSTRSILTLRPLPKIDPKDKGKKRIEEEDESDTESKGITKARINADKILAEELQKEEREKFTIEQRAKFLHDTIAAQRKFLAQQRSEAIRNKPPIRNQLRNQMMTYLKHVSVKKHSDLKTKTFEEIQVLYERLKRQDQNLVAIRSAEDERQIKELNKDPEKKRLKKRVVNETPREEDTVKVPAEQEVTEQGTKKRKSGHVKMIARKRPRPQPDDASDDEHIKCLRIVTFEGMIDSEIMETKSFIARLHKVSSLDGNYLVVYRVNGHFRAFNYLMEGDLKIMMESSIEENDQVIYMLVERRYPLSKELLQQMIDLGLEVEEESNAALQLGSQRTLLHSKELASPGSNSSCYVPTVLQQTPTFQPDTELAIPTFLPSDDPIKSLNKSMIFLSSVYCLKFLPTNNQLQTSSNPRTQATIQNDQVTVQNVQVDSLEETDDCECFQLQAITNFKADRVDAYDSDCDDKATTNAIFMANLSPIVSLNDDMVAPRYDFDTLFEVPHYDTYHDSDVLNFNIQELEYTENIISNNESYDELKGNNNVISYTDYMFTIGNDKDNYVHPPIQKNDMMLSVIEQMKSQVEKCNKEQSDIKGAFKADVIPFSENLKETFKLFEKGFIAEVKEMKDIFKQMEDEVSSLVKEREHIKLEYKKMYDSIKQIRAKTKLQTDSLQQKVNDQISENNKLRAQLKEKFSESQMNHNGTSVNTKLSKPSTSGTKLYLVTLFPKLKVIPKFVEKYD